MYHRIKSAWGFKTSSITLSFPTAMFMISVVYVRTRITTSNAYRRIPFTWSPLVQEPSRYNSPLLPKFCWDTPYFSIICFAITTCPLLPESYGFTTLHPLSSRRYTGDKIDLASLGECLCFYVLSLAIWYTPTQYPVCNRSSSYAVGACKHCYLYLETTNKVGRKERYRMYTGEFLLIRSIFAVIIAYSKWQTTA